MRVLEHFAKFRRESSPASWVYRITTNHCLNRLRSGRRRDAREQADQVVAWLDVAPIITHHFALADYGEAFETMSSGRSGKVVLDWHA